MKRIIMMVLRNILFVPWGWFMLNKYAANVDRYTEGERYALLKKIDHKANVGGNITVKSYGVENIPNENGFMFYPNHQGLYGHSGSLPDTFFCSCKERSGKRTVLTTGICLYEGIYYGSRRYPAVHADNPQCHKRSQKRT